MFFLTSTYAFESVDISVSFKINVEVTKSLRNHGVDFMRREIEFSIIKVKGEQLTIKGSVG